MAKSLNLESLTSVAPKLAELSQEVLFNDIWKRGVLSPRERSLITQGALTALGRVQRQFYSVPHSAGKPRSGEQKKNFCRVMCERLHAALDIHPDDVTVIIQFNTAYEWSFSQVQMLSEEGL